MIKSLYAKLAFMNIRKNGKLYIPYIISSVITIAMFYIMCSITFNKDGISQLQGASELQTVMAMGTIVIAIFSFIFLFYTNSFLMKRRKKELGLFNILGMEKRHISRVMFWEVLFTSIISLVLGLGFGILFDKLATMLLYKLLKCTVTFGFAVRPFALIVTAIGFLAIFFLNLLYDIAKVRLSNPIELLHGSNVGEKEPKTKWILAIIGAICLAIGYYIALTTESPLDALMLFFVAVLLVIFGTYFLFIAGSIALLKLLRKNKKYYYNPKHFTSVSGMLYRMKQNAVGLANICILSTMVLVMVSTTVCMYMGADDALLKRYPNDITVDVYVKPENVGIEKEVIKIINKEAQKQGVEVSNIHTNTDFSVTAGYIGGKYTTNVNDADIVSASQINVFCIRSESEYSANGGETLNLKDGEVAAYTTSKSNDKLSSSFVFNDKTYTVKKNLDSIVETSKYAGFTTTVHYVIVSDDEFVELFKTVNSTLSEKTKQMITSETTFDIEGDEDEQLAFEESLVEPLKTDISKITDNTHSFMIESRAENKEEFYSMYGSFLFLGIYLGMMFLMITVLIMYYKQISEGFDDKSRFEIMQKVGMSKEEVRKSIHSQVITVFFLPLVTAIIHIAFAFKMITRLMVVLHLTNVTLFLICTIATAAIFAVIYAIVYALTARSYYKIVE